MLDLPRYLLGAAEILLLAGFAWMGGSAVRRGLLPGWSGPPAWLTSCVLALALLIWAAEGLGAVGWFKPLPYVLTVGALGLGIWALLPRVVSGWGCPSRPEGCGGHGSNPASASSLRPEQRVGQEGRPHPGDRTRGRAPGPATLIAAAIAIAAVVHFAIDARAKLLTGMTGFDSTWYHGPFAAGFFQSGDTWGLHFIAPQFLAWFYPANAELFHAAGMLAFGRDILSPLLNLGWFLGCLLALWCIGRPYRVAPWSLALGAIALSLSALSDQAGEARNDIVGIFFLLAAVAIALSATRSDAVPHGLNSPGVRTFRPYGEETANASVVVGLAAGLAGGTKLNFLLPAAVLIVGLAVIAPRGFRWRALWVPALAALAGGGYWYLRNLVHTGNPLPWFDRLGPVSLPAPEQALGGREGHTVLGYLTDGPVWSEWFLPGLHHGLTVFWPLLAALALAGLALAIAAGVAHTGPAETEANESGGSGGDRVLAVAAFAGLAAVLAWLVAPTSASGPEGMPRGFESGLRYLAPALVLGLVLLPAAPALRGRLRGRTAAGKEADGNEAEAGSAGGGGGRSGPAGLRRWWGALGATAVLLVAVVLGYPIQRHYLRDRYANPTFAAPGLNAAFKWSNSISDARIATTSTRQYPLYGTDLSNRVQYVGERRPHGGFVTPRTCRAYRRLLNAGHYDYVVATRDRIEPSKHPYPPTAAWTAGPGARVVLRQPPTVVYRLTARLDPSRCP